MTLTHGSLFTGVGGFDLGADAAGIETLWQAEIDKKPSSVLAKHWPDTKRYGDVKDVKGNQVKPVDIISFGSPCQDLSIAGKQAGLQGSRSGLFFEAIRIIKEMQDATQGQYPRIAVWENVRGALSSNGGEDFHAAVQALAELGAVDISYRLVNACHFGVPQRRVRVFVVASFTEGASAGEILAKPTRLRWHPPQIGEPGQETTGETEGSTGGSEWEQSRGVATAVTQHPSNGADDNFAQGGNIVYKEIANCLSTSNQRIDYETETFVLHTDAVSYVKTRRAQNADDYEKWEADVPAPTLNVFDNTGSVRATVLAITEREGKPGGGKGLLLTEELSPTLRAAGIQSIAEPTVLAIDGYNQKTDEKIYHSLRTGIDSGDSIMDTTYRVRRLTPVECERLMGWPDNHTKYDKDGNELSDSARYKMCGNGIAAPVAQWLCENIVEELS
jgi:DNA (cytosine-5)-methyltransferase 1